MQRMKFLPFLVLALFPACGIFGPPEEVVAQVDAYEGLVRQSIALEREAIDMERSMFDTLQPTDAEAQAAKADLGAKLAVSWAQREALAVERVEAVRAIARYIKWPGLFGDSEQAARFDERLLLFAQALRGGSQR